MKSTLLLLLVLFGHLLSAQSFTEVTGTPFEGVIGSSIAFADVDGDGDQDALITGENSSETEIAKLYINNGSGNFTEKAGTPFDSVYEGSIAFADADGTGGQDVLITGLDSSGTPIAKLYLNDGLGNFTEKTGTPFDGVYESSIAFANVDGVPGQDVLITGYLFGTGRMAKLYTNDGAGHFTEKTGTPFAGLWQGSVAFADVDGMGGQDVLMTGDNGGLESPMAKLYTNDGAGNFTEKMGTPFDAVFHSSIAFANVDADDNIDVLITGSTGLISPRIAKLYRSDGLGNFTEVTGTPFEGVAASSIAFSDVDCDNDQDVLVTGINNSGTLIAKLYTNDGSGHFTEVTGTTFEGVKFSSIAFSDVDGDGDEDVLITGENSSGTPIAKLYLNDCMVSSTEDVLKELSFEFVLYPNPVGANDIHLKYRSEENGWLSINVFDLNGRPKRQIQEYTGIGEQTFSIDVSSLAKGTYFIQLENGIQKGVQKFLVP